jgi:outer membrane receptor protein involved in Fe transport
MAYTDAHYTQTLQVNGAVVVRSGDAVGAPPRTPSPLTVTASADYRLHLARGVTVSLRADDIYHSRNPGPFTTDNADSPFYWPQLRPDPATNVLNLRGSVRWSHVDLGLLVDNALDAQPTLALRPNVPGSVHFQAGTIRPRTIGVSATWRH